MGTKTIIVGGGSFERQAKNRGACHLRSNILKGDKRIFRPLIRQSGKTPF